MIALVWLVCIAFSLTARSAVSPSDRDSDVHARGRVLTQWLLSGNAERLYELMSAERTNVRKRHWAAGVLQRLFQRQAIPATRRAHPGRVDSPDWDGGAMSWESGVGEIFQRPCCGVPSSTAKQAGESKLGQHSQSIEPLRPTSAAAWQSPISA